MGGETDPAYPTWLQTASFKNSKSKVLQWAKSEWKREEKLYSTESPNQLMEGRMPALRQEESSLSYEDRPDRRMTLRLQPQGDKATEADR